MKYFQIKIIVPTDLAEMAKVRKSVEEKCLKFGYPDKITYMIVTAIDETCANVIKYAHKRNEGTRYVTKRKGEIFELVLRVEPGKFEIETHDMGFKFDPISKSSKSIDYQEAAKKKGGMGISFLKNILDTMDYQYLDDKQNVLKLSKHFSL
jgi:anti-sigma regulatory factor (Ser/Thr protein kinase)